MTKAMVSRVVTTVFLTLAFSISVAGEGLAQTAPTITLSPTESLPGAEVVITVDGSDFPHTVSVLGLDVKFESPIVLSVVNEAGSPAGEPANFKTLRGAFTKDLQLFPDPTPGTYTINAEYEHRTESGNARATFEILKPPTTTNETPPPTTTNETPPPTTTTTVPPTTTTTTTSQSGGVATEIIVPISVAIVGVIGALGVAYIARRDRR
jgi:hypothetical protein